MSEERKVVYGTYDYHPIVTLRSLIELADPAEDAEKIHINLIRAAEFKKRCEEVRAQIEAWEKAGLPRKEMAKKLGVSGETLYKYIKEYKKDKRNGRN